MFSYKGVDSLANELASYVKRENPFTGVDVVAVMTREGDATLYHVGQIVDGSWSSLGLLRETTGFTFTRFCGAQELIVYTGGVLFHGKFRAKLTEKQFGNWVDIIL